MLMVMNNHKVLIVVLVVLVVLFAGLWLSSRNDIDTVAGDLNADTADYKKQIAEKCSDQSVKDLDRRKECSNLLQDFQQTLVEYGTKLNNINTSGSASVSQ